MRPPITYSKAAMLSVAAIAAYSLCAAAFYRIVFFLCSEFLSAGDDVFITEHISAVNIAYMLLSLVFFAAIFAKKAAIGCIHLYQHYAPAEVRRRCLLKPTCSEYAILAIEKYGLIKGCVKTWHRLRYVCCGYVYHTDYP